MNRFTDISGFNWDEGNIDKNLIKHNVNNSEIEQIFFNKPLIIHDDKNHSQENEKRFFALGQTNHGRSLFSSFCIRNNLIRIISARDMNKKESAIYEKAKKNTRF